MNLRRPVLALVGSLLLPAPARAEPPANKFSVAKCQSILATNNEAAKTLRAILAATNTKSCSDVQLDGKGRTQLGSIDLKGKGLTDLSPFRLFNFGEGGIDLSHNDISDLEPLVNAARASTRINLSHTKVKDAAFLNKYLPHAQILDGNEIDDPGKLTHSGWSSEFSLRGNHSTRGPDYDAALETLYRYYALFNNGNSASDYHPKFDLAGLRAVLAPKLTRYITLKDVPVEAIYEDAARFYQAKRNVFYGVHLETFKVEKQNGQVVATYTLDYGWNDDDLKVADRHADEAYEHIDRQKHVRVAAEAIFDSTFHLVSYTEKTMPHEKLTVVRATWGTRDLADVINFLADPDNAGRFAKVKIPKGAVLEDAFEFVSKYGGNKYGADDNFVKVTFKGKVLWAHSSSSGEGDDDGELYIRTAPIPL
jgi:hypothetical protein